MAPVRDRPPRRYPLHVTISVVFTALLLMLGSGLIAFNFIESRRIALLGADDLFEHVGSRMRTQVESLYVPVQNLVDATSKILPSADLPMESRLEALDFFAEALRLSPKTSAIFVAYEDGDFLLARRTIVDGDDPSGLAVPEGATMIVQIIDRGADDFLDEEVRFYADDLTLLDRRPVEWKGFDPRNREWYLEGMATHDQVISTFYRFFTTEDIGVTVARRLSGGRGVVGADLALDTLTTGLSGQRVTPSTRVVMLTHRAEVIADSDDSWQADPDESGALAMPHVSELDDPIYRSLADQLAAGMQPGRSQISEGGRTWLVSLSTLPVRSSEDIFLAVLLPRDELLADVTRVRDRGVVLSLGLLALAVILVVMVSRHVSRSLSRLAREVQKIRELRFDSPITVRSTILEVDDLAATMGAMKSSLQEFLAISHGMSAEKDFDRLIARVLDEARRVSGADGGAVLLRSEDDLRLEVAMLRHADQDPGRTEVRGFDSVALDGDGNGNGLDRWTTLEGTAVQIDDTAGSHGHDLTALQARFGRAGVAVRTVLNVPLRTRQEEVIGVLQLVNARDPEGLPVPFRAGSIPYMEALASNAAVALDNRRLLKAQRDLLDSFIQLIAGAIDAKSPYTHGHCQRVPLVARMLAEAAHGANDGTFATFHLAEDEWYELHLASWLHDTGKVTTPEYVVDKATKLETLYNRIHEIRTRFEVLWRDAEIDYLRDLQQPGADAGTLRQRFEQRLSRIREDFEFVAECNLGDEGMTDERLERLRFIAARTWRRHLDDRLGLSGEESRRLEGTGPRPLPAEEPLLADRPEHIVPREGDAFGKVSHGFRMEVPKELYNRGELYNLSIPRGTLTAEERFKINEHSIQTIRMLGRLPFPRELRRVPDWAGNHHEKLDGTGYPRRISGKDLSIPERVMALADVFEALTATDRPYMRPKKLSQALGIMSSMCREDHLCPDLFALFLRSGVHMRYAEEHLQPAQMDEVDVEALIASMQPRASGLGGSA